MLMMREEKNLRRLCKFRKNLETSASACVVVVDEKIIRKER
jgi:hypothetical protein